jgi:hypothetical protein
MTCTALQGTVGLTLHIAALDGIVNVNSRLHRPGVAPLLRRPCPRRRRRRPGRALRGGGPRRVRPRQLPRAGLRVLPLLQPRRALPQVARPHLPAPRVGILLSAVGSVAGCGFLMMAVVNVVQVKLGRLGCGAAWAAVVPLVPAAMLIYIGIVFYAFTR